jgi:EAL domain-containing protein (putative c-di-GMP-specific phosphodiesterase class I)
MVDPARLLGFAFANADLLFEIEPNGTVLFATGATSEFVRDGELTGQPAGRLFMPSEGVKFSTYARALQPGGRAGPFKLKLAGGSEAAIAFCRLPQNGERISCTLTKAGPRASFGASPSSDSKTGLANRDSFLSAAQAMAGPSATLTLIEVPGLPEMCSQLPEGAADKLLERIGETIKGWGGKAAGRIGENKFGAIPSKGTRTSLADCLKKSLKEDGVDSLAVEETLISLKGQGLSPEQDVMAVRYVIDQFGAGKHGRELPKDLGTAFDAMLGETQTRALAFTQTVADSAFAFAFQPIMDLQTNNLSHYEALARFEGTANTGEAIQFAEALGISDAFDIAVAVKVLALAEADGMNGAAIALNLSGHTLASPTAFGLIAGLFAKKRSLAARILIELTETAEITDLASANLAIQALRRLGYRVGLDDFGAGATSLQYLHAFTIDYVKFDGSLVKKIGTSRRDDTLLEGMIKLCKELGVQTIAECIETAELLGRVRDMGFDLGQGYFLGKPAAEPAATASAPVRAAKRKGFSESWG